MLNRKKRKKDPELWVIEAEERCWKCNGPFEAVGLLLFDGTSYFKAIHVRAMNKDIVGYMASRFTQYQLRRVKAADADLFVNVCPHCGITNGDGPLHGRGRFNIMSHHDAKGIKAYPVEVIFGEDAERPLVEGSICYTDQATRIMQGASIQKEKPKLKVHRTVRVKRNGTCEQSSDEACPGCGSKSIVTRTDWLCYGYAVDVCTDCEWTRRNFDKVVVHLGSFAIYEGDALPPEAYKEEYDGERVDESL